MQNMNLMFSQLWSAQSPTESRSVSEAVVTTTRDFLTSPLCRLLFWTCTDIRSITIDVSRKQAWVDAGATLGELYTKISKASKTLAFVGGVCPTLGVGGHISGGGYGNLIRKYGISVDHVVDARIVDVNGNILTGATLGDDLLWAIRGGGGASFGVILSWKVNLVDVPKTVTVFKVNKTLEQGVTDVLYKWQLVSSKVPQELFLRAMPKVANATKSGKKTIAVFFYAQCYEMSWINTTMFWMDYPVGTSTSHLLDRPSDPPRAFFKSKSDYVKKPIPKEGMEKIWKTMLKFNKMYIEWNAYGGVMDKIPANATAFPHRKGNLFKIQYYALWTDANATDANLGLMREIYHEMEPYVSSNPREAFLNYRDIDVGSNPSGKTNLEEAKIYGSKYFLGNFKRLMEVKAKYDPENFFRFEQSIPPVRAIPKNSITEALCTHENFTFVSSYVSYTKNKRYSNPNDTKLIAIVAAKHESHVQATVVCAKVNGVQIRIRSGGHDYEGLSYISSVPFIILDMNNLRSITIDVFRKQAWVDAGATMGELYTKIAEASKTLAFAGGLMSTAIFCTGATLGRDLLWAIRGGGGASFGVILSWKINLVDVPKTVTVFKVNKTLEQGVTDVLYKWQLVSSKLPRDLFLRAMPQVINGAVPSEKTIAAVFYAQFLGSARRLMAIMNKNLPELGLKREDCYEMSWINTTMFWQNYPVGTSTSLLLARPSDPPGAFFKSKSDYVKKPIPKEGMEKIWKTMLKFNNMWMQWNPYGGVMDKIPADATAFPHRKGNLFKIQYFALWSDANATDANLGLMREIYHEMEPYVSSNPREAFLNYRDIDVGSNSSGKTNVEEAAEIYGSKYFLGNFKRLMEVKAKYDPQNFFRFEQSIPPVRAM
ncbi:unnamed protein product [Arabidopsis arenosa]|uniref:FAD-binding PCMH-type domain-containing protein n=1 Tax=Arabidopsis arenosa TaxID=38785 RepID=A0A8S2AW28_ARAAE|nr:unnamed protein product [Arabidopsis arenosa]